MTERAELEEAVAEALRTFSVEMEQYVLAASASAAIHRTDLTGLSHAMDATRSGTRLTPGELSARMGLSPSATTTMLDRLEAAGHVVRSRDSADRRVVTISITEQAARTGYQIFIPLAQAFEEVMGGVSTADLQTIHGFLQQVSDATHRTRPVPRAD